MVFDTIRRMIARVGHCSIAASLFLSSLAPAQPDSPARPPVAPSFAAVRTSEPPIIDAKLDDACWSAAAVITEFTQVDPQEGAPPSERTELRVCFDERNLYLAVVCYDADPAGVVAREMERDADLSLDDRVEIALEPYGTRRDGFFFAVGAAGGRRDGLIEANRNTRFEWDGLWSARVALGREGALGFTPESDLPIGWLAEIAIPFKSISFNPDAEAWGFNIQRIIRRKNETARWATPTRNSQVRTVADAGAMSGLEGLSQGAGLTIKPFGLASLDFENNNQTLTGGVDVFYKLTTSTTLAITYNTDFAEAEVDDRRVNLTRFPLFFPEKRAFFLQDAGVFSFGGIRQSPLPFFSRRIGIVRGEEKGILAGARLTGREGGLSFGVMSVQMDDDPVLGAKNLSVARAAVDILEESSIGLLVTAGDPTRPGENYVAGVDANFRFSNVIGNGALEAHAWVIGSETSDTDDTDRVAVGGRVTLPNDPLLLSTFAARIGRDFNPALGFTERRGVYEYNNNARYRLRPGWRGVRHIDLAADWRLYTTLENAVQSSELELPEVAFEFDEGDRLVLAYDLLREGLTEPFEIAPGVIIPPGDYPFSRFRGRIESSASRELSAGIEGRVGSFYDGTRADLLPFIAWQTRWISTRFEFEHNQIDLPQGDFNVEVARVKAAVQFSPELSWTNTVQYDNVSDTAGLNSRIRWEVEPGQEVFIVFNQGFDVDDQEFQSIRSGLTIKVGLTFRF